MRRTKRILTLVFLCLTVCAGASAQIPVTDAANIAQAAAILVEAQQQVQALRDQLGVVRDIHMVTTDIKFTTRKHYNRYIQALTKRGVVPVTSLLELVEAVDQELNRGRWHPITYTTPGIAGELPRLYLAHERADDPFRYQQMLVERGLGTVEGTLLSLAEHRSQLQTSHDELERFKQEIASNPEPQQMRDVQANLQAFATREMLMTRQALMTLTNLEAISAAHHLNREAQDRVLYEVLVGGDDWLGDPARYRVGDFMRMPGDGN